MEDNELPKPVGESLSSPKPLKSSQEDLCERMDSLHRFYGLKTKPSDMFRGAIFVSNESLQSNPDWIAQGANSLREILYPFYSMEVKSVPTNKKEILETYGSVLADENVIRNMGTIWGKLNGLAHHGNVEKNNVDYVNFSAKDFKNTIQEFEITMANALIRQSDIHKEIDSLFESESKPDDLIKEEKK